MTDSIRGVNRIGHDQYIRQTERSAWRQDMLNQMLEKVRDVQPAVSSGKSLPAPSGPPPKGSLLDIII